MRLEIIISDNTLPAVKSKISNLLDQLSAHPELINEIHLNGDADDAAVQELFTPERLAQMDTAAVEARAGQSYTREQVDEFLADNRAAWLANHPS